MVTKPTKVTQKGQVTIPVEVRRVLRLNKGDQVKFIVTAKKEVKVEAIKRPSIMNLYGSLKPRVKFKESDDIYGIIKKEEQAWPEAAVERDLKSKSR